MEEKRDQILNFYDQLLELDFRDDADFPLTGNRRDFLKLLGGGILILLSTSDSEAIQRGRRRLPDDFNAFLKIGEDGEVTGFTGKIEMGQGVVTSLAQMLADELDVSLDSVNMVMGDTDLCPWDMGTFGSMTTRFFGPPFRAAAAEAKAVLIELAAERLEVPKQGLKTKEGAVYDEASGRKLTYAELASGQRIVRRLEGEPVLEDPAEFTIVGKPILRRDAEEKVTGKAKFAGDITHPEMLHARIRRPPAHGATLRSIDTSGARQVEGVKIIEKKDLIAVLHSVPDSAEEALDKLRADYELPKPGLNDETIHDHLINNPPEGETVASAGSLEQGEELADTVIEKIYLDGYVAHAPIEPHTAVAKIEGDHATIWASTQTPFGLKEEAASALGFPAEKVRVMPPFVGGGYGGKTANRQAIEAARLAKLTGRPVQVAWTRAEEFFLDRFRPASVVKIKGGVTASGMMTSWDYGVYGAGQRGSEQFYNVPHHQTVVYGSGWMRSGDQHPLATGPWRAPANNTNTFARESHIDALAAEVGIDPIEFRLKNLADERMKGVLQAVAVKFGWTPAKAPSGRGFGVACGIDAGTYVAHIAVVEVDKRSGKIQVKRVVCAQDMGLCVNPEGAEIQMEGCITMGLGYALAEEIQFQNGKIKNTNFDSYKIPRFSWLPEIESVILVRKNYPPQGGGEPAIICMGAVLANAVFDATGARPLQIPMTPARIKKILSA